jgi:hypothetical protein
MDPPDPPGGRLLRTAAAHARPELERVVHSADGFDDAHAAVLGLTLGSDSANQQATVPAGPRWRETVLPT